MVTGQGRPRPDDIARAVSLLRSGGIVAIPTDTVYGLAADPSQPGAVDRLFLAKRRPRDVQLPLLVADLEAATRIGVFTETAEALARTWWPGPLTIVVERREGMELDLGGPGDSVGIRVADHPVTLELCRSVGALAVTSANLHGEPPCETAEQVARSVGEAIDMILDYGPLCGSPSTVVAVNPDGPVCLRQGSIAFSAITSALADRTGRP